MSTLPPVDRAALPPEIRRAGAERQRDYAAALGFERQLVAELTKSLAASSGLGGPDRSPSPAGRDLLPTAMADTIIAAGGLGIARELDRSLHPTERRQGGAS